MPDPSPNIDPKEATEAKLCAYLENELAPAERAEIEQHLAANPQHRQLLADLAKTREWMRSIPSESSPVDLAEIFQAQVERTMLLDESQGGSRLLMRWPQYVTVAAIVVLTLGLGVLVVEMLKGPKTIDHKSFSLGPAAPVSTSATQPVMPAKGLDLPPTPMTASTEAPTRQQAEQKAVVADAAAAQPAVMDAHLKNSESATADSVKAKLLQAGYRLPTDHKTVCFVVSADTPPASIEQVRGFFTRHQLAFDDAITGKHESPAGGVLAFGAGGERLAPGAASQPYAADNTAKNNSAVATAQNSQNQQGQAQNSREYFANNAPQSQFNVRGNNAANGPTTSPTDRAIYVAYGLTPLQVELLSASLETNNVNQAVQRLTLSEAIPPPTVPPAGAFRKGQALTITVAELVGPGIEKTNVVKITDDGMISLPMIDPLPAAGVLPAELERRIADKYKEANLIPQATVTVAVIAPTTTQAVAPTTNPATQPVTTTQPAAPLVTNNMTNVVVVIEKPAAVIPVK